MKPVLIQNLIKNNKGKFKATTTSKEEVEQYHNKFASFVLWFIAALVLAGLFLG